MKTILILVTILLFSQTAFAIDPLFKGDTVRYKFDKMLIEYAGANAIKSGLATAELPTRIKQLQKVLAEMNLRKPDDSEMITITFRETGENMNVLDYKEIDLRRTNKKAKSLVVFNSGQTFEKDFGRYCIFFSDKSKEVKLFVDEITDLDFIFTKNYARKVEEASQFLKNKFGKNYRKNIRAWLDLRNEKINGFFQESKFTSTDMILLEASVGAGFVKNQSITNFGFRLGFAFGNKGIFRNNYFVDYDLYYNFVAQPSTDFNINSFLSLGFERNFSTSPEKDNWYGISLGYLVGRNDSFFGKNATKISVHKRLNNSITLLPEIYFDDFYKNGKPGLRVQISF